MLIKKYIISFLTVIFLLVGCDSDSQNLDNETDVSTVTSTNDDISSESEEETEETEVKLSKPVIVETIPSNWYIRLVSKDPARGLQSSSTQLGELEESDAVQNHALKALNPFEGNYLDIVFIDPDGIVSGDYKSIFHVYNEDTEDQWYFTVRTDDINAEIVLTWQGLYVLKPYMDDQNRIQYKEYRSVTNPLIQHMKLVDTVTGQEVAAMVDGKIEMYTFNMNGKNERHFKWVTQIEKVLLSAQISKVTTKEIKVFKSDAEKQSTRKKSKIFDLSKPPMIK